MHDPNAFVDPNERYLNADECIRSPGAAVFGLGRRVSNVLAVYNIKPPADDEGNEVKLKREAMGGLLSYLVPFKCAIEPWSSVPLALIQGV